MNLTLQKILCNNLKVRFYDKGVFNTKGNTI